MTRQTPKPPPVKARPSWSRSSQALHDSRRRIRALGERLSEMLRVLDTQAPCTADDAAIAEHLDCDRSESPCGCREAKLASMDEYRGFSMSRPTPAPAAAPAAGSSIPSRDAKPEQIGTRVLRDIEKASRDAKPEQIGTRVLRDIEKVEAPRYLWIEVSNRCQFRCTMCYNWKGGPDGANDVLVKADEGDAPMMTVEEVDTLLFSMRDYRHHEEFEVSFTGSEPTLNPRLLDYVALATKHGYRSTFPTNAWDLREEDMIRMRTVGLTTLMVSLDGPDAATHDGIRGVPGSFDKVQQVIAWRARHAPDTRLGLLCTIQAANIGQVTHLARRVQRDDRVDFLSFQAVTQPFGTYKTKGESRMDEYQDATNWFENPKYKRLWPSDSEAVHRVFDELGVLFDQGKIGPSRKRIEQFRHYFTDPRGFMNTLKCRIGDFGAHVTLSGDYFFCFYMKKLGNARTHHLGEAWSSDEAAAVREKIATCPLKCDLLMNCSMER